MLEPSSDKVLEAVVESVSNENGRINELVFFWFPVDTGMAAVRASHCHPIPRVYVGNQGRLKSNLQHLYRYPC